MENIVPIDQLRNHISKVLEEIRFGVNAQRITGLIVDMPEEVTFSCQVVFEFQSMAVRRVSETTEDSNRTEGSTTTDTGESTRESKGIQTGVTGHDQLEVTTYERTPNASVADA